MAKQRRIAGLIGETLREIGVLVVVFYPLEIILGGKGHSLPWVLFWVLSSVSLTSFGIYLEYRSARDE